MYERLLHFLRCPVCAGELSLEPLVMSESPAGPQITEGLLCCAQAHWFPVVRRVPRMFPDALERWWSDVGPLISQAKSAAVRGLVSRAPAVAATAYDARTQANFSAEWEHHELGDRTWGMDLDYRVRKYFLDPIGIPREELAGKVLLDAGCGNGSQSVAYSELGLEVIAVDLSAGVDKGEAFRAARPGTATGRVHFVQADLQAPPLARSSIDIIHSAGVLHHTPDTHRTFQQLAPLLRPDGSFYIWLYKYEPGVTPLVNAIRRATTRMPTEMFTHLANLAAEPFRRFTRILNAVGVRSYTALSRREAALALMDIFGAPYAHYHSFPEVSEWFRAEGFTEIWGCNDDRRGFGACARRPAAAPDGAPRSGGPGSPRS